MSIFFIPILVAAGTVISLSEAQDRVLWVVLYLLKDAHRFSFWFQLWKKKGSSVVWFPLSAASLSPSGTKHQTAAKLIKNQYAIMNGYINTRAEASQQQDYFFLFFLFFFLRTTKQQQQQQQKRQEFSQMNISSPSLLLHFEHKLMLQQDYKAGSHLQNFPRQKSHVLFEVKQK